MLSDEEKEALRNFKSEYETSDHYSSDLIIELDDAEVLLNLIEKQSKEIEKLNYVKRNFDYCVEQENKRWKDKIKAKVEDILNSENGEAIEKLIEWQSLLEKE